MKKALLLTTLLLLAASVASAEVTEEMQSFNGNTLKYPVVSLPKQAVADKINKHIAKSIENLKKQHSSLNGPADQISMSYKVLLENNVRLNILLYSWTYNNGAAHGQYYTEGLSYNLYTGKKATPEDYIPKITAADLDKGVRENMFALYSGDDKKPVALDDFWKVETVSKECILEKDGSLTLIYQPYDLAPYVYGNTFINIAEGKFHSYSNKPEKYFAKAYNEDYENDKRIAKLKLEQEDKQHKAELKAEREAQAIENKQQQQEQKELAQKAKQEAKDNLSKQKLVEEQAKEQQKQELQKAKQEEKIAKQQEKIKAKDARATEKAQYTKLKNEHKEQMQKLKTQQRHELEQYRNEHAKTKTKAK